jgi:hypothetical protein
MAKKSDVHIGKFDILATYTYAKAILDGAPEAEAKERGMVAAIMGAKAKLGHTVSQAEQKTEAEEQKKQTITAESFEPLKTYRPCIRRRTGVGCYNVPTACSRYTAFRPSSPRRAMPSSCCSKAKNAPTSPPDLAWLRSRPAPTARKPRN